MKTMTITISVAELNELTAAAIKAERMYVPLKTAEESCRRKREELRRLQAKYEELKAKISGSGETEKPQANETNADEKPDAVLVDDHETEGRVSGGERAGIYHSPIVRDATASITKDRGAPDLQAASDDSESAG